VAITRARSLLIIVGNPHLLECDPNWKELIDFTKKLGSYRGCLYMPRRGTDSEWVKKVVERFDKLSED
jgi:helicase MOV-10